MEVRLTRAQVRYLLEKHSLPEDIVTRLREFLYAPRGTITLTSEERSQLGNIIAQKLVRSGFDQQYEPTSEGELLESIIDALTSEADED